MDLVGMIGYLFDRFVQPTIISAHSPILIHVFVLHSCDPSLTTGGSGFECDWIRLDVVRFDLDGFCVDLSLVSSLEITPR